MGGAHRRDPTELGTADGPGMRRIIGRVGAYRPFGWGHEDIKEMAGIAVGPKAIERIFHQLGKEVNGFESLLKYLPINSSCTLSTVKIGLNSKIRKEY